MTLTLLVDLVTFRVDLEEAGVAGVDLTDEDGLDVEGAVGAVVVADDLGSVVREFELLAWKQNEM